MSPKNPIHSQRKLRFETLQPRCLLASDVWGLHGNHGLDAEGEATELTWSIVPDGTQLRLADGRTVSSNLQARLNDVFGRSENWEQVFERAFEEWDELSGLDFAEVTDDGSPFPESPGDAQRGEIRIGGFQLPEDGPHETLGYTLGDSKDIVLNTDFENGSFLNELAILIQHEAGHAIGLEHVYSDRMWLMQPVRPREIFGPLLDDIWQIQQLYGDAYEPNDHLGQATDLGAIPFGVTTYENLSIGGLNDVDLLQFSAAENQQVTVRAIPQVGQYKRGDSEDAQVAIDQARQSRLQVELLDASGNVLFASQLGELGDTVSINQRLPASNGGKYFFRILGDSPQLQLYRLAVDMKPGSSTGLPENQGDVQALRAQIEAANASGQATVVMVPDGIYNVDESFVITGNVILRGSDASSVVLDGGNSTRLLDVRRDGKLRVERMTVRRGRSADGAGISVRDAELELVDAVLTENTSPSTETKRGNGGGLFAASSTVTIENSSIAYNHTDSQGGGFYSIFSDVTIRGSRFIENTAGSVGGINVHLSDVQIESTQFVRNRGGTGAIHVEGVDRDTNEASNVEISDSWFIGNQGEYGGALNAGRGLTTIRNAIFEDNIATWSGGAVRVADQGQLDFQGGVVRNNRARSSAGFAFDGGTVSHLKGVSILENVAESRAGGFGIGTSGNAGIPAQVIVDSSTIAGNRANRWFGGGIGVSGDGALRLVNSTVSGNSANNAGAGITSFAGATIEILHSTIVENYLDNFSFAQGGGVHIHPNGSALLTNSIVANNTSGGEITDTFGDITMSHSLIGVADEVTAEGNGAFGNIIGSVAVPVDPRLGPLANGPTPYHRLLEGSPAIDAGIATDSGSSYRDQRGAPREDGQPDIGSFEEQGPEFANQAPTMDSPSGPITIESNSGLQSIAITGIDDGDEGRDQLQLTAATDNQALLVDVNVTEIDGDRSTLTFRPAPNATGAASIRLELRDLGGDRIAFTADDIVTSQNISVTVVGDQSTRVLTILDTGRFEPLDKQELKFSLQLSSPATEVVSVDYATLEDTATAGEDFEATSGTIVFQPGEDRKEVSVAILGDDVREGVEHFFVTLKNVVGAELLREQGLGSIFDDPTSFGEPILPSFENRPSRLAVVFVFLTAKGSEFTRVWSPPRVPDPADGIYRLLAEEFRLTDVNRDGATSSVDALIVLNHLNGTQRTNEVDVNRDGTSSAIDALIVINALNMVRGSAEGEAQAAFDDRFFLVDPTADWLDSRGRELRR